MQTPQERQYRERLMKERTFGRIDGNEARRMWESCSSVIGS